MSMFFAQSNGFEAATNYEFGAVKKKTVKKPVKKKLVVSSVKNAAKKLSVNGQSTVDRLKAEAARLGGNSTNTDSIPQGGKIKYVATFLSGIYAVEPLLSAYYRNKISGSKQAVKAAFEKAINDVNVTVSTGGGAMEVIGIARKSYSNLIDVRRVFDDLMTEAVDVKVESSFLEVIAYPDGTKTGRDIKNSPTNKKKAINKKIDDAENAIGNTILDTTKAAATGFFESLGLTLGISAPILIVIAVFGGIYLLKKK